MVVHLEETTVPLLDSPPRRDPRGLTCRATKARQATVLGALHRRPVAVTLITTVDQSITQVRFRASIRGRFLPASLPTPACPLTRMVVCPLARIAARRLLARPSKIPHEVFAREIDLHKR